MSGSTRAFGKTDSPPSSLMPPQGLRSSWRTFQTSVWFGQTAVSGRSCRKVDLYWTAVPSTGNVSQNINDVQSVSDVSHYAR
ncbi:hypothetical protein HMPREF9607_02346 [Cutibacterium modestum HL044PA1]|uniref:Uncharacterized protein n=1 Tax=Cutibacterium modestum HL044PA1 TaxID=765109 RepID=A0ABN0C2M8_9ACTN|nr:hypothetical protein HMPREF9607_02346 [Cutibacterium modestum HL044PA1]